MKQSKPFVERAERFLDKSGECWLWVGAKNAKGYGICYEGLAHRVMYQAKVGPIPEGAYILHKCDVRNCCNPAHLYAGTQKENVRDMWSQGRAANNAQPPGERHSMAKLTEADALDVIRRVRSGERKKDVGRLYGIGGTQVARIASGQRWAHLQQ